MYSIVSTKSYRSAVKKIQNAGRSRDLSALEGVVNVLASGKRLPSRHRDHKLTGSLRNFRECHVRPDLLLIYRKDRKKLVLVLVNLGSHDELFS